MRRVCAQENRGKHTSVDEERQWWTTVGAFPARPTDIGYIDEERLERLHERDGEGDRERDCHRGDQCC